MKISYNWLKQYIQTDLPAQELSEILTNIGLEVEGLETFQSVKGGLEGVVIGEVLSCEKHPDADKLTVCIVSLGESEPVQIVCGAPNVAAGQKVPVATVGCTLYPDDEGFTIKKAKIRGVHSMGMICAEDELGLGTSHDGIMVLDSSTEPGVPAADYFKVETDMIFEIGLTPNRIDGASHLGVARDLAA
jgi:phenylalanyl-tRNA synthetase beta chain